MFRGMLGNSRTWLSELYGCNLPFDKAQGESISLHLPRLTTQALKQAVYLLLGYGAHHALAYSG